MEETQRGEQAEGEAMEVVASPTHSIHLFEQPPDSDADCTSSLLSPTHKALSAAAFTNFDHIDASVEEALVPSPAGVLYVASASNSFSDLEFSQNLSSQAENVPLLPPELDFTESKLLMAIASLVQEYGPSGMSTLSDGVEVEEGAPGRVSGVPDELRTAICDHPLFPEMALAHIAILKIGAPKKLHAKVDDVKQKFQRSHEGVRDTSKLGQDPELDRLMKSYGGLLSKFREQVEEPFNKFTQFVDKTTKKLEGLCGHYVETKPEEEDNFGYDIGPRDEAHDSDSSSSSEHVNMIPPEEEESSLVPCPLDVDKSVVVNPEASEEELKKALRLKYGPHIGALAAEFRRVRKKGKLPDAARRILKNWFNNHAHWPYPTETEKTNLQEACNLTQRQINNWFINERKRHWNGEERIMNPNIEFNDVDSPREGSQNQEHL